MNVTNGGGKIVDGITSKSAPQIRRYRSRATRENWPRYELEQQLEMSRERSRSVGAVDFDGAVLDEDVNSSLVDDILLALDSSAATTPEPSRSGTLGGERANAAR